jgi:hypothetical protein
MPAEGYASVFAPSPERIDETQGYTPRNLRFVCRVFQTGANNSKSGGQWTRAKFMQVALERAKPRDETPAFKEWMTLSLHNTDLAHKIEAQCRAAGTRISAASRCELHHKLNQMLQNADTNSMARNARERVPEAPFPRAGDPNFITLEDLLVQVREYRLKCPYLRIPMSIKTTSDFMVSLERVDPRYGYTASNIRLVCVEANASQAQWSAHICDLIFDGISTQPIPAAVLAARPAQLLPVCVFWPTVAFVKALLEWYDAVACMHEQQAMQRLQEAVQRLQRLHDQQAVQRAECAVQNAEHAARRPENGSAGAASAVQGATVLPRLPPQTPQRMVRYARVGSAERPGLPAQDWSNTNKVGERISQLFHSPNEPDRPKVVKESTLKKWVENSVELEATRAAGPIRARKQRWSGPQLLRFAQLYAAHSLDELSKLTNREVMAWLAKWPEFESTAVPEAVCQDAQGKIQQHVRDERRKGRRRQQRLDSSDDEAQ